MKFIMIHRPDKEKAPQNGHSTNWLFFLFKEISPLNKQLFTRFLYITHNMSTILAWAGQ